MKYIINNSILALVGGLAILMFVMFAIAQQPELTYVIGNDEKEQSLINVSMNNKSVDPPENRVKIAFVATSANHILFIERVKEDTNISKSINITTHLVSTEDPASYQNINMSDQNVIMLVHLGYPIQDAIKKTVQTAKDNGAYVITYQFKDVHNLSNVNLSDPEYSNITKYWDYSGEENMNLLITFIGVKFCNVSAEILPPVPTPLYGIYHPDAPNVFEKTIDYLNWYNNSGKYNASNCTIGIHYYTIPTRENAPVLDALINLLESKGANVIFATYTYKDPNSSDYFIYANKSIVDAVITLTSFRLHYRDEERGIEYLRELNVTPLKGISSYYYSEEVWNNSTGLSPSEIAWQIALPELDGLTEFIFVGGKTKDNVSNLEYYEPVKYQMDWITNRVISYAKLRRMNNSEKKVAIIYYNHGGGKNNLGASYLDISPSLKNLLDAMKEKGYEVGNKSIPNRTELIDLMIHQGRNIGTWAPEELEKMVNNYSVMFIPEREYMEWFKELPKNKREEVIDKWGEPPGKIMIYENESGKYIVIPGIKFGNVFLTPQPTRGWLQNNSVLYHDKELAPHHQYIAFYFWLKKKFGADAIIHFGTHGTQEWLPGKETALSVKECWPAILIQDLPVIYPYIMDNVGEGTQAKRRGNAVLVDHLTPPIVASGLYGNLSILHGKIHAYHNTEGPLKAEYRETIIELYNNLSLDEDLGVSVDELRAMNDTNFENFVTNELHEYIHELADAFMPYGLHILGTPPDDWKLISMVKSMLGDKFNNDVAEIYPNYSLLSSAHENCTVLEDLLSAVLCNRSTPVDAQMMVLGKVSANVTEDLNTAVAYADNITKCSLEIPRILDGLAGRYVPPNVGNDPIRNPSALPTGNNFYSFDPRLIPKKEAWNVGKQMVDELLRQYKASHNGSYPKKVAFVLWAVETIRHEGIMESEILYLMGVRPVWDSKGRVKGVSLMNAEDFMLDGDIRPRIDVLVTTSGLYRDTFPDKVKLIDKAVRLAYDANDTENYIKMNSDAIYDALNATGNYTSVLLRNFSMARIFSEAPGTYGTGLPNAIAASNTWDNDSKLANLYISRLGYIYGADGWGAQNVDIFRQNLANVEVATHSDSSNLYGVLDNDDYFQYLGGLALAVRSITGKTPDLYVTNLKNPNNPKTENLNSYLRQEIRARYFNPKWIKGMMEHDYAGAREMDKFLEYMWGWDVTVPDLITEDMWNEVYDIYIQDKYNLGLKEFFNENNPYALQSMVSRMLEAERKKYWNPSDEVKTELAKMYDESVKEYDVTCCHHTCANPFLDEYRKGILSAPIKPIKRQITHTYSGGAWRRWKEISEKKAEKNETLIKNETREVTGVAKTGEELKKPPKKSKEDAEEVVGKVMEKMASKSSIAFSGVTITGIIVVLIILVLIYLGFVSRFKKKM